MARDYTGSRAYAGKSFTFSVDDTGVIKDWPTTTSGLPIDDVEIIVRNADVFLQTGLPGLLVGALVTVSDDADAHDRMLAAGDIIPDLVRTLDTHDKIGLKCATGQTATVTINPGAKSRP